jgi:K+-transporting ATPase ATPase B chain
VSTQASSSIFDPKIAVPAVFDSVRKLDPRRMARNPVMFVTEIGAAFATLLFLKDFGDASSKANVFAGSVAAWLWFTVLFANFAEAMAEGRGKAQAATLRKTRAETTARKRLPNGTIEELPSSKL